MANISNFCLADNKLDSLKSITDFENDGLEITTYFEIADVYYGLHDDDSFSVYATKSYQLAQKSTNKHTLAKALRYKGRSFSYRQTTDSALFYLNSSLAIFQKLGDSISVALVYSSLSGVYHDSYLLEESISYMLKSLKIYEKFNKKELMIPLLANLSLSFARQEEHEKALNYLKKAYYIFEFGEVKDVNYRHKAAILCQMARTFGNLYEQEEKITYLDSVYHYANKGLAYSKENKLKFYELTALDILYGYFYSKEDFKTALKLVDEILLSARGFSDKHLCIAYKRKSNLLLDLKEPKKAAILADSALNVALRMNWKSYIVYSYDAIYRSNEALGNYKKALYALEKHDKLEGEIINQKTTTAIHDLETKYQTEKKENKIIELEQKYLLNTQESEIKSLKIKRRNWIIIGLLLSTLSLMIFAYLFNKQQKLKKDKKILETKHKLLRSQMNPHFLFNGFTALQRSILKDDNKINAVTHLGEFSRLMRSVLESSFNEFVSLTKELDLLENYLKLQRFRFGDLITYQVNVDEFINKSTTLIPPMLLQPFLENAIEHGRGGKGVVLHLSVNFELKNEYLMIEIQDNGIGLNKKDEKQAKHVSRALSIVKERLELLEPILHKKSTIEICNLSNSNTKEKGVKVILKTPHKILKGKI